MSNKRRVVITGMGLINPLGNNTQTCWAHLITGKSGISRMSDRFDLGSYPVSVAGFVKNEENLLELALPKKFHTKTDRFIHLLTIAAHEAMHDASLSETIPVARYRFGSYVGVGIGGLSSIADATNVISTRGLNRLSPFVIPQLISNIAPAWLSMLWQLKGPHAAIANACASSTDAVGLSFRAIRNGYADYMLAGGTESCVIPLAIAGFGNMRALTTWDKDPTMASRPFDKNRSGFVIAEGASALVLESLESAHARSAHIYAEIIGYGATSDAFHITAMHPDAEGAVRAINEALYDAKIIPTDVEYINAHGTSTPMNDKLETLAIKKVFAEHASPIHQKHVRISSTKSMTGHLLGAAGATEVAFTALALKHQILPPTINLDNADPACDLDYIPHKAITMPTIHALSQNFGFGGANSVIVLKQYIH